MTHENQHSVAQWAFETFGPASHERCASRTNEEMAELLSAISTGDWPYAAKELADVMICLYRLAENLGIDLHAEVNRKMSTNRRRKWKTDGTGCGYHVR